MHFEGKGQTSKPHVQHDLVDKNIHKWVKPENNNGRKYHKTLPNPLMYFLFSLHTHTHIQVCVCMCVYIHIFFLLNYFLNSKRREAQKEPFEAGRKVKCRKPPICPSLGYGGSGQSHLPSWLTGMTQSHRTEKGSWVVGWLSVLLATLTKHHLIQNHYSVDTI